MTQQALQDKQALNQRQWQAHVQAFRRSGLSRAEYCRQYKLSYHALTYWHRKIAGISQEKQFTLVPIPFQQPLEQKNRGTGRAALRVIMPGRFSVDVGDDFSPAVLQRLLSILDGC